MHVLIYDNKEKDSNGIWLHKLVEELVDYKITYQVITDEDLTTEMTGDAVFALGGDGTILCLNEFANKNEIPIIGINTGKLGFLAEFEKHEIKDAVRLFAIGDLVVESRCAMNVTYKDNVYCALNDTFVQRIYTASLGCMVSDICVLVDDKQVSKFKGDGVIICTPTGATAYSLSAGGPILSPEVDVFSITPIAAHSFNQRAIVCSANSYYSVIIEGRANVGLFVDGRYIANLKEEECFFVKKAEKPTLFLRKKSDNFFNRLSYKLLLGE